MTEKAAHLAAAARSLVGRSYTRGPLRIIITAPPEVDALGRLVVWVTATRDGVALALDLPFVYVNPPLNVPDPQQRFSPETGAVAVAPLKAFQTIVADTVGMF